MLEIVAASEKGELVEAGVGALDEVYALHSAPAFMVEIGSGDRFENESIAIGVRGIKKVMHHLKMISGELQVPEKLFKHKRDG